MAAFGRAGNLGVVRGSRNPGKRQANRRGASGLSRCAAKKASSFFSRPAEVVRVWRFLLCSCRGETEGRAVAPEGKRPALDKGGVPVVKRRLRKDHCSRAHARPRNRGEAKPDQY